MADHNYLSVFWELISTPFLHLQLIWGIVPLYFGLLLNELTPQKANFRTSIQTGFSFLWAGIQWAYAWFREHQPEAIHGHWKALLAVNAIVTLLVLTLGAIGLVSGLRRKFPRYMSFLGRTRFSNYFMIAIFPIQAQYLTWSWARLTTIALFAVPIWIALHLGLKPFRSK